MTERIQLLVNKMVHHLRLRTDTEPCYQFLVVSGDVNKCLEEFRNRNYEK